MEIQVSMTSESVGVRKSSVTKTPAKVVRTGGKAAGGKTLGPKRKTALSVQTAIDKLMDERAAIGEKIKALRVELRALKPKR